MYVCLWGEGGSCECVWGVGEGWGGGASVRACVRAWRLETERDGTRERDGEKETVTAYERLQEREREREKKKKEKERERETFRSSPSVISKM